jgi:DNA-binding IclR family transcriptional regulator
MDSYDTVKHSGAYDGDSSVHVLLVTFKRLGYVRRVKNSRDHYLSLKNYALWQRMAELLSGSNLALPRMQRLAGRDQPERAPCGIG